jgi:DnaJ-class molecular chaperone
MVQSIGTIKCASCDGTGRVLETDCRDCHGIGHIKLDRKVYLSDG